MARPKKKPEARKPNWVLITCLLVLFTSFAALVVAYKSLRIDFEKRAIIVADQMRILDDVLVKRRHTIERLERELSDAATTLMNERKLFSEQAESFIERERMYRETINALETEIEKQRQEIQQLNKRKPHVRRRRYDGVVRPRVYKW